MRSSWQAGRPQHNFHLERLVQARYSKRPTRSRRDSTAELRILDPPTTIFHPRSRGRPNGSQLCFPGVFGLRGADAAVLLGQPRPLRPVPYPLFRPCGGHLLFGNFPFVWRANAATQCCDEMRRKCESAEYHLVVDPDSNRIVDWTLRGRQVEVIFNFFIGFHDSGCYEDNLGVIARRYIMTPSLFFFDILTSIPLSYVDFYYSKVFAIWMTSLLAEITRCRARARFACKRWRRKIQTFCISALSSRCVSSSCSRSSRSSTHSKRSSPSYWAWPLSRWLLSLSISSPACMSAPVYIGESRSTPTTLQNCNSSSCPGM